MKILSFTSNQQFLKLLILFLGLILGVQTISADLLQQEPEILTYTGVVTNNNSEVLPNAVLSVEKTNISTVTNADGEFSLKIPASEINKNLLISFLGHENLRLPISSLRPTRNRIRLKVLTFVLPELEVLTKDPNFIIQKMLDNKSKNYSAEDMMMTAFYRETIKKRRTNISLSEAVVEVYKRAYSSSLHDMASLYKSRKSTDYSRLDTLVFKLMGGPFNNIYLDIMRYPDFIFSPKIFENYEFKFVRTDHINDRLMYVINFQQLRHIVDPLFYGLLYIDAENYALARAEFDMDLTNNAEATRLFVRKKPFNAKVNTTQAHYIIDYRLMDDLWYYSYSRIDLGLRINWKRKLFHTYYNSTIEMAATDWSDDVDRKTFRNKDSRISPKVVIHDEASGFADPEFWGEFNIIEPEKSIENAINKIQKQLKRRK